MIHKFTSDTQLLSFCLGIKSLQIFIDFYSWQMTVKRCLIIKTNIFHNIEAPTRHTIHRVSPLYLSSFRHTKRWSRRLSSQFLSRLLLLFTWIFVLTRTHQDDIHVNLVKILIRLYATSTVTISMTLNFSS